MRSRTWVSSPTDRRFPVSTLLIEGGHRLSGRVEVEGNKNAALPLLAACLLTEHECVLTNVPRIADVEVMARLLLDLGAEVDGIGTTTVRVRCPKVTKDEPDPVLVGRLRGSVLLLGPLLARRGRAVLAPPGGDFPARRTISTHLAALHAMGAVSLDVAGHGLHAPDGLRAVSRVAPRWAPRRTRSAETTSRPAVGPLSPQSRAARSTCSARAPWTSRSRCQCCGGSTYSARSKTGSC